jgi:hypothetical protein
MKNIFILILSPFLFIACYSTLKSPANGMSPYIAAFHDDKMVLSIDSIKYEGPYQTMHHYAFFGSTGSMSVDSITGDALLRDSTGYKIKCHFITNSNGTTGECENDKGTIFHFRTKE